MKNLQTNNPDPFWTFEHTGWERCAKPYHHFFSRLTNQTIEPLLDSVGIMRSVRLLDIATGPGYVAAAAAKRGAVVTGIDFAIAMLAKEGMLELPMPAVLVSAQKPLYRFLHVNWH